MGKEDFCCAEGSSHQRSTGATCNFYKIPDEPTLRGAWLTKISRVQKVERNGKLVTQPWKPSKSTKLCGCHFENPPPTKSRKKWFLVPTIFSHRPSSEKKSRRPLKERTLTVPSLNRSRSSSHQKVGSESVICSIDPISEEVNTDDRNPSPDVSIDDPVSLQSTQDEFQQPTDHDYITTNVDEESHMIVTDNPGLQEFILKHEELVKDQDELKNLKENCQVLTFKSVIQNTKLFQYYTGLKVEVFNALFKYLEPKAKLMKYPYGARTVLFKHHADSNRKKPGKTRGTSLDEEMFITLVKLKLGLQNADCAVRFGMAASTFSSIFTAWVTLLSQELEKICKMPPTTETDTTNANCFNDFPNVRVVIDCTELFAETPSSVGVHKQFHSSYKHHSTVKFLVGMNTGGAITYISEMYGGRASDKFITNESEDLLDSLNAGEKVMADRGFTIKDDLPAGVKLIIPSFKHKDKSQFTKAELQSNKKISEARVHIERGIRRIKQFQILKNEMKLTQVDIYSNIFTACAYLVNFQDPFLKI